MSSKETFNYKMNTNSITMEYTDKKCWIESQNMDVDNITAYFVLLKHAMAKMKEKNIEIYEQLVSEDEWDNYLEKNELWTLERRNIDGTCTISCKLEIAAICIAKGFGLCDE